jgi:hypothetical protein
MMITIDTRNYRAQVGQEPKGRQLGGWNFKIRGQYYWSAKSEFAKAVTEAKRQARKSKTSRIEVIE